MFLSAYYEPKEMRERQADLAIAFALQDDLQSKREKKYTDNYYTQRMRSTPIKREAKGL